MPPRKVVTGFLLAAGSLAGSVLVRRRAARKRERVDLYAEDGSMHSYRRRLGGGSAPAPDRPRALHVVSDPQLGRALREAAYLEGDFVLRSGRRSTLLPRQVPLRDTARTCSGRSVPRSRRRSASTNRRRPGSPARSSARSPWRPRPRWPAACPFLIVRSEAKAYGTANRLEGVFAPDERVCLVEDVVTSGGAALGAIEALRAAGLQVSTAICVVDREEGGADQLARHGVRLRPLFRASELLEGAKHPANPLG